MLNRTEVIVRLLKLWMFIFSNVITMHFRVYYRESIFFKKNRRDSREGSLRRNDGYDYEDIRYQPTCAPGLTSAEGAQRVSVPSGFTAERIIPWLSSPIILRGAKLAM